MYPVALSFVLLFDRGCFFGGDTMRVVQGKGILRTCPANLVQFGTNAERLQPSLLGYIHYSKSMSDLANNTVHRSVSYMNAE